MNFKIFCDFLFKIQTTKLQTKIENIKQNQVLFFFQDTSRSIKYNNKAFSPLADSLQIDLKKRRISCQTIALPWSKLVKSKAYGSPVSINRDRFFELAFKKCKLPSLFEIFYGFRNPYHKIISRTKPKFIISIGCPDDLCREARIASVRHAELLHGMGYNPIPWGWDEKSIDVLPQIILTFDKVSFKTFSLLESKKVKTFIIPHPFYKKYKYLKIKNTKPKTILVSLTWGYAGDHGDQEMFKGILKNGLFPEKLINLIKKLKNLRWKFRLHPVQKTFPKYKELIQRLDSILAPFPNCEWKKASEDPFPEVIKDCSGHLTMNSMSCYDAAYFGVTSLVFCPTVRVGLYKNMFADLEKKGFVKKISFSDQYVQQWIATAKLKSPYRTDRQKRKEYNYQSLLRIIKNHKDD